MNLSKLLRREIENQIEDRVVPILKIILSPSISPSTSTSQLNIHDREDREDEEVAKILGHMRDNGEWIIDPITNPKNQMIPFIQDENGFI